MIIDRSSMLMLLKPSIPSSLTYVYLLKVLPILVLNELHRFKDTQIAEIFIIQSVLTSRILSIGHLASMIASVSWKEFHCKFSSSRESKLY